MKKSSQTLFILSIISVLLFIAFILLDAKGNNRVFNILKYLFGFAMIIFTTIYGVYRKKQKKL